MGQGTATFEKILIMKLTGNKILVTGGASGIGLGLVERFVKDNNTVIICGRRLDVLQGVADKLHGVIIRQCDLAVESDRVALYDWVAAEHPDLNVLVNNAGIQNWMNFGDADFYQRAKTEITTNIEAPLHLMTLFIGLPALKTILNVTSGLAFVPLTKVPVYSATKAFFRSLTLSARYLLEQRGVQVIEIVPPALNTDLGGKGIHDFAPPVSDFIVSVFEQLAAGKTEIAFQFSEAMANAVPQAFKDAFSRMNP